MPLGFGHSGKLAYVSAYSNTPIYSSNDAVTIGGVLLRFFGFSPNATNIIYSLAVMAVMILYATPLVHRIFDAKDSSPDLRNSGKSECLTTQGLSYLHCGADWRNTGLPLGCSDSYHLEFHCLLVPKCEIIVDRTRILWLIGGELKTLWREIQLRSVERTGLQKSFEDASIYICTQHTSSISICLIRNETLPE